VEVQAYRKNGEPCWIRVNGHPLLNDAGRLTHYLRVCTDISRQRQIEMELRSSESHFRALADATPMLIWMSDTGGLCSYFNQGWLRFTGRTLGQEVGDGWAQGVHPEDLQRCLEVYRDNFNRRCGFTMEYRLRRSDGEFRWIFDHGEPRFNASGEFQGFVGSCYDIHDRIESEKQLQQVLSRQSALISAIPDLMFLLTAEGVFVAHHVQRKEDLILPADAFLGKHYSEALPPELGVRLGEAIASIQASGQIAILEFQASTVEGRQRNFETRITRTSLGEYLIVSRDITERILADLVSQAQTKALAAEKERAEAASKAKSEFLAVMSHEIRTPLNGILGMTELLLDAKLPPEEKDAIKTIWTSASSLATIVNDVLDFSRIEAGRLELESVPFNLLAAVQDLIALMRPRAREKQIELRLEVAPGVPEMVIGDPVRIRQIVLNFLTNAIKFTQQGSVVLSVSGSGGQLRVSVKDTGCGIPEAKAARLFERFTQADSSTTRRYGGTGLGLAISKQLAELMGGSVGLESEEMRGSTFYANLPLPEASFESKDGFQKKPPSCPPTAFAEGVCTLGRNLRALVVEDNPVNQKVAVRLLEKLGCSADLAENGKVGVEMYSKSNYDVIFMDCRMPVMDGFEATRKIRETESGTRIPIVAITASAIEAERNRCLDAGMNAYLSKPVSLQRLSEVLEQVAEMPHVLQRSRQ
jgi:PAS domain S-box-containing protein